MTARKRGLLTVVLTAVGVAPVLAQEPRRDLYGDPLPSGAVARIGTVRLRTPGEIARVALSSDGTLLVTSNDYLPLRVWDATTGALLRMIPPPADGTQAGRGAPARVGIAAMAFPADSRRWLHVLTADGTLRECDVTDGTWSEPLARTETPGDDYRHAGGRVSPDRTLFLYTPFDDKFRGIEVFAVGKGKPVLRIEDPGFGRYGRAGSVSADNGRLAAVLEDGTAKMWDLKTGKAVATHTAPDGVFYSVAISPDGKSLAAVCGPKDQPRGPVGPKMFLYGWDAATGKERFRTPDWEGRFVTYTPDGSRLVSFTGNEVLVADPATGKLVRRLQGHGAWAIFGHGFSADGKRLVTGSRDHTAIIWDLTTGKPILDFDSPRGPVDVLAFSPDGKTLFTGCSEDHTGGLWDAETGKRKHRLVADRKGGPIDAAFTPDGQHVVVGYGVSRATSTGKEWTARLWSMADGKLVREFGGHTDGVHQLAVSPDGNQLATWDWGQKARLWDLGTGKLVKEIEAVGYQGQCQLAFRQAGQPVVAMNELKSGFKVLDLATGKVVIERTEKARPGLLRLSDDARLGVFVQSNRDRDRGQLDVILTVRDILTDEVRLTLPANDFSTTSDVVALSPDGKTLAIGRGPSGGVTQNREIHLYDVATGKKRLNLAGHSGWVCGLAFSPDGKRLATGGWDSTALVWDLTTRP